MHEHATFRRPCALTVFALAVLAAVLGCGGPPDWQVAPPPAGVTPERLEARWTIGRPLWTLRVLVAEDAIARIERLEEYTTTFDVLNPRGRPIGGERRYSRGFLRVVQGQLRSERALAASAEPVRIGVAPPAAPGSAPGNAPPAATLTDPDAARSVSIVGFDDALLPEVAVYPGAHWVVPPEHQRRLDRFLRQLGLVVDRQRISVRWADDTGAAPGAFPGAAPGAFPGAAPGAADVARLTIDWQATGTLLGAPRGRARLAITGTLRYSRSAGLIVDLDLTVAQEIAGQRGTSHLRLLRHWDGPPAQLPDDLPELIAPTPPQAPPDQPTAE